MPNLMITTGCNLRCDYCFGAEVIGPGHPARHMSWETYVALLDWIERGNVPHLDVHLMGGEPTIHPLFQDMYRELLRRGRKTRVFSNAAVPLAEEKLTESATGGIEWVVNVNTPDTLRPDQWATLERNLALLGEQAVITFNITRGDTPYRHVFDLIEAHRLRRQIKIGVALPTLEHKNVFVWRSDFAGVAERLAEVITLAGERGVAVEFECGVPFCLFSPEQRERLAGLVISSCGSRLDIMPDGEVINCLPLYRVTAVPFRRFSDYAQAFHWFRKALRPYRLIGADADCLGCEHLEQARCYACLAYGLGQVSRIVLPPLPEADGQRDAGDTTCP